MLGRVATSLLVASLFLTACNRLPGADGGGGAKSSPAAGGGGAIGSDGGGGGSLPSGTIVAFVGSQVPAGWTICDGRRTAGGQPTPDLRGRFIMGSDPIAVDAGQQGGSATHTHAAAAGPGRGSRGTEDDDVFSVSTAGHTHPVTVEPADSLPPFVKLVYIMKD